eukprot:2998999-Amphidinium_carterae.1
MAGLPPQIQEEVRQYYEQGWNLLRAEAETTLNNAKMALAEQVLQKEREMQTAFQRAELETQAHIASLVNERNALLTSKRD